MNRPAYETAADLERERAAIKQLVEPYGLGYSKLDDAKFGIDYAITKNNKVVRLVEVKCRSVHRHTYKTLMLSAFKRISALRLSRATNVPAYLLVKYIDCMAIINFDEEPDHVAIGGRNDRGDSGDIEPVIHYAIDRFKVIND